jgi:hypothetical protein
MNNLSLVIMSFAFLRIIVLVFILFSNLLLASAQSSSGGTVIKNRARATFSDEIGRDFSIASNTVEITVANVAGLSITPDAGTMNSVVRGQTGIIFPFIVTNTGNFSDQVRFLANGASLRLTGQGSITAAVIDVNNNNTIDAGDINILTNSSDLLYNTTQNSSFGILVQASINSDAIVGSTVQVFLGDSQAGSPTFDTQVANNSANEVRTVSTTSANSLREGRGDISVTVANDALIRAVLSSPSGPIALGENITYTMQACNDGARTATFTTLGGNTGVYIIAPVPTGTVLSSTNSFPAGTLYTTSALTITPQAATWTTAPPSSLSSITRVAFNTGTSLSAGACTSNFTMIVNITIADATHPITEIIDVFATNYTGTVITDQSGDNVPNIGDGNANFNEGTASGNVDGNGTQQETLLLQLGSVLIGPLNHADATGPTNNQDDYTNLSINTGIADVGPGGTTSAAGSNVFSNTIKNTGTANDTFIISAPSVPSNITVEISTNNGSAYTTIAPGGGNVSLPVAVGQSADILIRITVPAGQQVLTAFDTIIRATSSITSTAYNETIDRLYTGFIRLNKIVTVINGTGSGAPDDPIPGATVDYRITYTNISSTGGNNSSTLTANNLLITEDGNAAPNNWGVVTDQVVGSATDSLNGTITGDVAGSSLLTDTIPTIGPGQSGVFRFRRTIK